MVVAMRIETASGSTYLVGPSDDGHRTRVARVGPRPVRGTFGPLSFGWDFDTVEIASVAGGIRLRCRNQDGTGFETSPVVNVTPHHLPSRHTTGEGETDQGQAVTA